MKVRLSETIDAYQKRRKLEDITMGVLKNELSSLTRLLKQTGGNLYMESIKDHHIDDTLGELAQTNSPRSMANHFHVFGGFFKWCLATGRVRQNPMAGMKPPKFTVRERNRLEVSKFPEMLDAALFPRDRFLMATGLYTLSRTIEIRPLRIEDIKWDLNRIKMDVGKRTGRQVATDLKPMTIEFREELDLWLPEYERMCGPLQPHWYLIPTRTAGNPLRVGAGAVQVNQNYIPTRMMSQHVPKRIVQEALEAVGFPTRTDDGTSLNEGMHTLRRSGARARYDAKRWMGHDNAIRHVQMLLNHANANMTELYIGINLDKIERDEELIGDYMYPQNRKDGKVVDFATQKALRRLTAQLQQTAEPEVALMLNNLLNQFELPAGRSA